MKDSLLTVLTPAPTYDLTTLETIKDELGVTATSQDTKLLRWIHDASDQIASYLGRVLASERVQEVFTLSDSSHGYSGRIATLKLARWPVSAIESITIDDDDALTTDEWEIEASTGRLHRMASVADGTRINWCGRRVVVVYTGGYVLLDGLPRSIEAAALTLLRHRSASSSRDPALRSEVVPGVYEVQYWVDNRSSSATIPQEAAALLDRLREPAIG